MSASISRRWRCTLSNVRLARFLLDRLDDGAASVNIAMSQTDLAHLIGTTRQRADAALLALENAGAIHKVGTRIEANDAQALRRIARRD